MFAGHTGYSGVTGCQGCRSREAVFVALKDKQGFGWPSRVGGRHSLRRGLEHVYDSLCVRCNEHREVGD